MLLYSKKLQINGVCVHTCQPMENTVLPKCLVKTKPKLPSDCHQTEYCAPWEHACSQWRACGGFCFYRGRDGRCKIIKRSRINQNLVTGEQIGRTKSQMMTQKAAEKPGQGRCKPSDPVGRLQVPAGDLCETRPIDSQPQRRGSWETDC